MLSGILLAGHSPGIVTRTGRMHERTGGLLWAALAMAFLGIVDCILLSGIMGGAETGIHL